MPRLHLVGAEGEPGWGEAWRSADREAGPVGFWRDDDGLVGLVGVAHTTASGCAAFVLPEGFRPARDLALPVVTLTRGDYAVRALRVGADGAVHPLSGTTQIVHFDGVCFYAAGVRP